MAKKQWVQDELCRDPLRKQLSASVVLLVSEHSLIDLISLASHLRNPNAPS